jgi:hypothetical protein
MAMKTYSQIMKDSKLLAKIDELRRLQGTLDWVLSLMDDLSKVLFCLDVRDPEVREPLLKVYRPMDRKADEVSARIYRLENEIEQSYADLLVQEAEADEEEWAELSRVASALQVMPPPYLERIW